jgi:hypothetical protein
MPARTNQITETERSRRFIETAKQLEADETGERFERAFKKIVPPKKPKDEKAPHK